MEDVKVEIKIDKFLSKDCFNINEVDINKLTIQMKMTIVNMKDIDKWKGFKIGLRT